MPKIDLHCHSTISDGMLTPADLVGYAASQGVSLLALTDHDDVGGLQEARIAAGKHSLALIDGVEISVSRNGQTLHIVGLKIDPAGKALAQGLERLRTGRTERAAAIAAALDKIGIKGSLEGAYAFARERIISRTHFARFLISQGCAKDMKAVFKKYLAKGKPGYVPHPWAELGEAVGWIREGGGIAVLAHPGRYDLSKIRMRALLAEFKEAGGAALEVVTAGHTPEQYRIFAGYAAQYGLLASRGSDYHGPGLSYLEMGKLPDLPAGCTPVWYDWPEAGGQR